MEETMDSVETTQTTQTISKRKARILQSTFARLRRQAAKFASKKHKMKMKRENNARIAGAEHRLPKQKRHDS
jgi:hypothetical protein